MQYLLFIRADENAMNAQSPEDMQQVGVAVAAFDQKISDGGNNLGSIRLQPPDQAITLSTKNGAVVKSDGPYAETKEQIGGIYCIEADGRDEAERIARELPTLRFCTVEVWPVLGIDLRGKVLAMHDG